MQTNKLHRRVFCLMAAAVFTVVYLRMNWLNSRIGADRR